MKIEYTEITTRWVAKCSSCDASVAVGEQAVFVKDGNNKTLLCMKCGESELSPQKTLQEVKKPDENEDSLLISEIYGQVKLHTDLMSTLALRIEALGDKIDWLVIKAKAKKSPKGK